MDTSKRYKWFTDGEHTIKIYPDSLIPEGFKPGRTFKTNPWNKGLTSDIDSRVKRNCDKCHETRRHNGTYDTSWNKHLTKDSNASLKIVSDKLSAYQKQAYENGKINPRKGLHNSIEHKQKQSITMKKISASKTAEEKALAQAKSDTTKRKNNSYNTSASEIAFYEDVLLKKFSPDDIEKQHVDPRYPFKCDFYIKSQDLFIELNLYWHHGLHPFNNNTIGDINKLKEWQKFADHKKSYRNAIDVWTRRDINKLNHIKENNLHCILIYPKNLVLKFNTTCNII